MVSIIVPIYNVGKYLEQAMQSLVSQTYENLEIICVYDEGNDNSKEILDEFASKDNRVRVIISPEKRGLSAARNLGMKYAIGKYVYFFDPDDVLQQDAIEKLVRCAESNNLDVVYFNCIKFKDGDKVNDGTGIKESLKKCSNVVEGKDILIQMVDQEKLIYAVWTKFYRRDFLIINHITFFEGIYAEDVLYTLQTGLTAQRAVYIEETFYHKRIHKDSLGYHRNKQVLQSYITVLIEIYKLWYGQDNGGELNEVFYSVFFDMYRMLQVTKAYLKGDEKILDNPATDAMFRAMSGRMVYKYAFLTQDNLEHLRTFPNINVFGAGNVGVETVLYLKENNIPVDKILVSDEQENPTELSGIKVCQFRKAQKEEAIVVGIVRRNSQKVVEVLKDNGYKNIIPLDEKE